MHTFKGLLALASCAAMVVAEVVHARDGASVQYKADNYNNYKCTYGEPNCKEDGTYCRPGDADCKYDSKYDTHKDNKNGEVYNIYDGKNDDQYKQYYCKPEDPNCKYSEKKHDDYKHDDKKYDDKQYDGNYGYKEGEHKYEDKKYDDKSYEYKPETYGNGYAEGGKYDDKPKCYDKCYKECCAKCDYKPNYDSGLKEGYKPEGYGYGDKCHPNFQGKYFSIFSSDSDGYKDQKDYKPNYWCWKGENKDGGYISVYPCEKELWGYPGKWIVEFTGKDDASYNIKLVENTERNLRATKSHEDKLILGSYGGYSDQLQIKCDKCSYDAKSFYGCTISNEKYCVTSKWEDGHALTFEYCDEKSNYQRWNFVDQTCKEDDYLKGGYSHKDQYPKDQYHKDEAHY